MAFAVLGVSFQDLEVMSTVKDTLPDDTPTEVVRSLRKLNVWRQLSKPHEGSQ